MVKMFSPPLLAIEGGSMDVVSTAPIRINDKCVCAFCENSWIIPMGYTRAEEVRVLEGVAKDHFINRIILQDEVDRDVVMDSSHSSRLSLHGGATSNLLQSLVLCDDCVYQFAGAEEKILKAQKSYLSKMTGQKDFCEILADPWLDVKRMAYAKLKSQEADIVEKLRVIETAKPRIIARENQESVTTTVLTMNTTSSSTEIRSIESLSHGAQLVFATDVSSIPGIQNNLQLEFVTPNQPHHSTASVMQEPALNQQSQATSPSSSDSDSDIKKSEEADVAKPGTSKADVSKPGTSKADVSKPGKSKADVTKPGTSKADVTKPGTSKSTLATALKSMNFNAVVSIERLTLPISNSIISKHFKIPSSLVNTNGKKAAVASEGSSDSEESDDDSKSKEKENADDQNESDSDGEQPENEKRPSKGKANAKKVDSESSDDEDDDDDDDTTSKKSLSQASGKGAALNDKGASNSTTKVQPKGAVKKEGAKKSNAQIKKPLSNKKSEKSSTKASTGAAVKKLRTSVSATPEDNPMNKAKSGTKRPLTSTPLEASVIPTNPAKRALKSPPEESPIKSTPGTPKTKSSQIDELNSFEKPAPKSSQSEIKSFFTKMTSSWTELLFVSYLVFVALTPVRESSSASVSIQKQNHALPVNNFANSLKSDSDKSSKSKSSKRRVLKISKNLFNKLIKNQEQLEQEADDEALLSESLLLPVTEPEVHHSDSMSAYNEELQNQNFAENLEKFEHDASEEEVASSPEQPQRPAYKEELRNNKIVTFMPAN
ncbi:hypothetical protein Ocin01_11597, partial [Orchesella cincta]